MIPEGFNNNIHWHLGHILVAADMFILKGNEVAPAEFKAFFSNGTKPADWSADVPSVETVLALLQKQAEVIQGIESYTIYNHRKDEEPYAITWITDSEESETKTPSQHGNQHDDFNTELPQEEWNQENTKGL